jgi:hypothetical protein
MSSQTCYTGTVSWSARPRCSGTSSKLRCPVSHDRQVCNGRQHTAAAWGPHEVQTCSCVSSATAIHAHVGLTARSLCGRFSLLSEGCAGSSAAVSTAAAINRTEPGGRFRPRHSTRSCGSASKVSSASVRVPVHDAPLHSRRHDVRHKLAAAPSRLGSSARTMKRPLLRRVAHSDLRVSCHAIATCDPARGARRLVPWTYQDPRLRNKSLRWQRRWHQGRRVITFSTSSCADASVLVPGRHRSCALWHNLRIRAR